MIFKNIDIHGCSELDTLESGAFATRRVPGYVHEKLCEQGKSQNINNTGIEFRFVLEEDEVTLKFRYRDDERGEITVYYGEFVADWPETTKIVKGECEIKIIRSKNIEALRKIAKEYNHRFSPDVIRLVFRGARPQIFDVVGKISVPSADMYPKKKYLAYGSSITHGSIALHPYYNYVERVAANLGADVTNYGFAGSARMQPEFADFIAEECEFDFATLEMGVNMLNPDTTDYENRIRYFVKRIAEAHPNSKIFAIDVYYCRSDILENGIAEGYRKTLQKVVGELALPNVIYVNGKTVLTNVNGLSEGLYHPNPNGIMEMAQDLTEIISAWTDVDGNPAELVRG